MAAAPKKLVHVEMIIPHTNVYDIMEAADGVALAGSLHFRPVKHGGEAENGELKSMPTQREFIVQYVMEHSAFTNKELFAAMNAAGFNANRNTISSNLNLLLNDKAIKRTGKGAYERREAAAPKKKAKKPHAQPIKKTNGANGNGPTLTNRMLALLKHAPEDGMQVQDIRKALPDVNKTSISPTLTVMFQNKQILRPSPGMYRISAAGERQLNAH